MAKFKISVFDENNGQLVKTLDIEESLVKAATGMQVKDFNQTPNISLRGTEIDHIVAVKRDWMKWFDISAEWELEILD